MRIIHDSFEVIMPDNTKIIQPLIIFYPFILSVLLCVEGIMKTLNFTTNWCKIEQPTLRMYCNPLANSMTYQDSYYSHFMIL